MTGLEATGAFLLGFTGIVVALMSGLALRLALRDPYGAILGLGLYILVLMGTSYGVLQVIQSAISST